MSEPVIQGCVHGKLDNLYLYQGIIREKNLKNIVPEVDIIDDISLNPLFESVIIPRTPIDKMDRLLLNLSHDVAKGFGQTIRLKYDESTPLAYARDKPELLYLLNEMNRKGYFANAFSAVGEWQCQLSIEGWDRIYELMRGGLGSKQIFVACWFNRLHDHYRLAIEHGIEQAGYLPMSIKDKNYPDTIMAQALGQIRRSRFVVVDLTQQRNSVFVEWGFAMGIGLKFMLVVDEAYRKHLEGRKKKSFEFYAKNYNIRPYSDDTELTKIVSTAIGEIIGFGNADLSRTLHQ